MGNGLLFRSIRNCDDKTIVSFVDKRGNKSEFNLNGVLKTPQALEAVNTLLSVQNMTSNLS
jgi:hypothetical protein